MATQTQKYLAELIGTFLLVFVGTATIVGLALLGTTAAPVAGTPIFFLMVALAFGLTLTFIAYTFGGISGAHVNPAVTIGMLVARRISAKDAVPYIVVQIIGAVIASAVVWVIAQGNPSYAINTIGLGQNGYGTLPIASAFVMELVITFVLVWVVLAVTDRNFSSPGSAGLAIGLALVALHLGSIAFTSTGINPARSIGPALFVGGTALSQLWLFVVAPIVGGVIAAASYNALGMAAETETSAPSTTRSRA